MIGLNVDSAWIVHFSLEKPAFWQQSLTHHAFLPSWLRYSRALLAIGRSMLYQINGTTKRQVKHFAAADVVGVVTPEGTRRVKAMCQKWGSPELSAKVHMIPHPVSKYFECSGSPAAGSIRLITVGRWDDIEQKRVDILMEVIPMILESLPAAEFHVFGKITMNLGNWHESLATPLKQQIHLGGIVPNDELRWHYQQSHIYLCVSAYESFLIAAAEAMCCGCSVVACDSPLLPGPKWFAQDNRGSLARELTAASLSQAAAEEAAKWLAGKRDGAAIANWATNQMHASRIAARYLELATHPPA